MLLDEFIGACRGEPGTKVKLKIKSGESAIEYSITAYICAWIRPILQ